ncbi:MAG: hypothetical protein J6A79_18140, partial [Clostridia bacterium]|nr:hypothetical protein [Clostridia bacterium]
RGVRLISIQHLSKQRDGTFGPNGLTIEDEDGGVRLLAAPKWNWSTYYREMIRRVLDGGIQDEYESSTKALNYYWGMSAGVVDIQCGPSLPEPVCRLAEALKQSICGEVCQPFALPIRKQSGESVGSPGESASLEEIMRMDYLVENVAGAIPAYNELSLGRETVEVMGIELPSEADTENPVIDDECLEKKTARVQL